MSYPEFPKFKLLQLEDRDIISRIIKEYQPQTSEWTFTNLYIWRSYYRYQWSIHDKHLLILCNPEDKDFYFLQPLGPRSRLKITLKMMQWLKQNKSEKNPRIERADKRLISEIKGESNLKIEPMRDHFDYVYLSQDLIKLSGRKYHSKKNHINKFKRKYRFKYNIMTPDLVKECIRVLIRWCAWRDCEKYPIMRAEFESVHESLLDFEHLNIQGGVILVDNNIEAFSLGELLNKETAVIHAEKADPHIPEVFTLINQQFCENQWSNVKYINREQDLGEPGLRKAKLSYQPHSLSEKFKIQFKHSSGNQ
jgi:hypothetical protein